MAAGYEPVAQPFCATRARSSETYRSEWYGESCANVPMALLGEGPAGTNPQSDGFGVALGRGLSQNLQAEVIRTGVWGLKVERPCNARYEAQTPSPCRQVASSKPTELKYHPGGTKDSGCNTHTRIHTNAHTHARTRAHTHTNTHMYKHIHTDNTQLIHNMQKNADAEFTVECNKTSRNKKRVGACEKESLLPRPSQSLHSGIYLKLY